MVSWVNLINKRVLVRDTSKGYSPMCDVEEISVVEVSPSGLRLKFRWFTGHFAWVMAENYEIVELLPLEKT